MTVKSICLQMIIAFYRIIKSLSDYAIIQEDVDCISSFHVKQVIRI